MIQPPISTVEGQANVLATLEANWKTPLRGNTQAPIVVLCDPPSIEAARQSLPMDMETLTLFAKLASRAGFNQADFLFVGLCPPISRQIEKNARKVWDFVAPYGERVRAEIEAANPRFVVTLGALPARVMAGRSVAVNKNRGRFHESKGSDIPYFPMQSMKLVAMQPDNRVIAEADFGTLGRVKRAGFDPAILAQNDAVYEWCFDLQHLVDNPPPAIAWDTEGTGLDTTAADFRVLTVQITTRPGHAYVCRVSREYQPDHPLFAEQGVEALVRIRSQIAQLIQNPSVTNILQNGKFDAKAFRTMGIELTDWWDTELMARFVNENFMQYGLDEMVRIYVPQMSGYADHFNQTVDKSRMIDVPPEQMLPYAGGDTDATFRLALALKPLLAADPANLHVFNRIHRRALVALTRTMETHGFSIDEVALQQFQDSLGAWIAAEERRLTDLIPAKVRRKYLSDRKGFKFSRDECMRSVLFGYWDENGEYHKGDGYGLKPKVFTPGTAEEPRMCDRLPSVSTKDHMPYHTDAKGKAGDFVNGYIALKKAQKIYDTYAKGFWKYIRDGAEEGSNNQPTRKVVPQYNFRTNTKRSNSNDPNGQNFPKRGDFAKPFRRLFMASPGKVLVASDLSQAELRVAAWMANEREMLRIYREGGDIHIETAAQTMGITVEAFAALERDMFKLKRFGAKAVNFGYIYGAQAPTFRTYAKTQYGIDYTMEEAEAIRDAFFVKYGDLIRWHNETKAYAHRNGEVRSLHGLTRHLHAIWSSDRMIVSSAERNAVNSPVQNFGSDLGIMAFLRLSYQADPDLIRPVGFIHDQLVAEVDAGHVAEGMAWLKWIMENPPLEAWFGIRSPIPIVSDPEWGQNLADSTELADDPEMTAEVMRHYGKPSWWDDDEERAWQRYVLNASVPQHTIRDLMAA